MRRHTFWNQWLNHYNMLLAMFLASQDTKGRTFNGFSDADMAEMDGVSRIHSPASARTPDWLGEM
mgnify:CR=1 FL=1